MDLPTTCDSFEVADGDGDGQVVVLDLSDGIRLVMDALGISALQPEEEGESPLLTWDEVVQLLAERA